MEAVEQWEMADGRGRAMRRREATSVNELRRASETDALVRRAARNPCYRPTQQVKTLEC